MDIENIQKNFLFYFFCFIHIITEFIISIYIFIFPKKYDIYFMLYVLLIHVHWYFFKDECILMNIVSKNLGIEIIRIKITNDSIIYLNRINKEYYKWILHLLLHIMTKIYY